MNDQQKDLRVLHEIAGDGRTCHKFKKEAGAFTCACGATADRFGRLTSPGIYDSVPAPVTPTYV